MRITTEAREKLSLSDDPVWKKFHILNFIGSGSYGVVHKVLSIDDNLILARKKIFFGGMTLQERSQLVSEINVMRTLNVTSNTSYFVRFHSWTINYKKRSLYLYMEYCPGGNLAALITKRRQSKIPFSEAFIWIVASQLIEGLNICHNGSIPFIHRDIKPENIFIDSTLKIGDFGLAKILSHDNLSTTSTFIGTLSYMAPELFTNAIYGTSSDMWSLGCILYEMCTFRSVAIVTFYHRDPGNLRFRDPTIPISIENYSHRLELFIQLLLAIEVIIFDNQKPNKRPTSRNLHRKELANLMAKYY